MSLEQNDIYILDKSGRTIYFNAMHEVNYDSKFFIFNKTFYKDRLIKIFEENVEKINNTYLSNNNLNYLPSTMSNVNFDFNSFFDILTNNNNNFSNSTNASPNAISILKATLEKSSLSQNELKKLSENLIEAFDNSKNIFRSLKINVKICEKIRDNYNYQYNSLECIYKNISVLYEQCYNKYRELENDLSKMNEKNEKTLNVFKDSIDKLKSIELHPKMQGLKEKFLIDIYFDESKMNVWKEKCVKSSDFITKKIKTKGELIVSEKNKIRNEKNTNILQLKNDWNIIIGEYENLINEKETSAMSILSSIYEDLKTFVKNINLLNEFITVSNSVVNNSNDSNNYLEEIIENIKKIITKYNSYKEILQVIQQHNNNIDEFSKKMKNLLIKSSVQINVVFTNYHLVKKNLLEIMEKVEKYSQGLSNLEKDFSYLANPSYFPQAYQASIIEIKRRIIFNRKLMKDFERLKQLVVKENINRKQFIQDYGKYLTHDYVPQLKFSDLKLSIDFSNNEEIINLPNILDEEEENTINNNNIYLDYDEFITQSGENLMRNNLQNGNSNMINMNMNMINLNSNVTSMRKNSEENNNNKKSSNDYEEQIRNLNAKITELEIVNSIKESEIKKVLLKLEQKDRKITYIQSEVEKLASTIENVSENFLKQLSFKDQKLKEKVSECENMIKVFNSQNGNKLDNCPMCRETASNSIDYQGWGNFVKDYHEKIIEKNKILSKIESRYHELITQTSFIKKTFFNHLHTVIETKNNEIMKINSFYENKLMNVEDLLSQEKIRNDKHDKNDNELKAQCKTQNQSIQMLEAKIKDLSILLTNYEADNKILKKEKEKFKTLIEESKSKENNLLLDVKVKETKCENLLNDYKNIEKQNDLQKKSINQLSEEIIVKVKEITNLKFNLESKEKILEELEKALENSKINHIETLNEVHKSNQSTIEKLNMKIEEMTQILNEKLKMVENMKYMNQELTDSNEKKKKEVKFFNEKLEILNSELNEIKLKNEELLKLNEEMIMIKEISERENTTLKKKLDELKFNLTEKDKKINEFNELTKFFSTNTNENNFFTDNNKTNANTNNEIHSENINTHSLTVAITNSNFNLNNITKFFDFDEFINVKRLEKGLRSIFVPHSPGVYVCINLNPTPIDITNNFESNYEINKYYKCNAILNIDSLNSDLKELLIENSLIIIGKVLKTCDHYISNENNPYQLPEDNTYILVDLEKIDYVIGFQGEEMIFRNYLF